MNKRISLLTIIPILLVASISSAQIHNDRITITTGVGYVKIDHVNAYYNCVQDSIGYDYMVIEDTLYVWEIEEPEGGLADCICYFDLSIYIWNVYSGPWHVVFNYLEYPGGVPTQEHFHIEVPGEESWDGIVMGGAVQSDCYPGTVTEEISNWGNIKTLYR